MIKKNTNDNSQIKEKIKTNNFNIFVSLCIKKAYLMLLLAMGLTPVLTSCGEKDDSIQEKIEELEAQLEEQTVQVRAAIEPAKTDPYDIAASFNRVFTQTANNLNISPVDIVDSSKVFTVEADSLMKWYGEYANPTNMTILRNYADNVVSTHTELQKLLSN